MKRLMFALVATAISVCSQAAVMKWQTGSGIKAPTSATNGTFGESNAGAGTLSMYVWVVTEAAYKSATYESISTMDTGTANASITGKSGALGATASWTYSSDDWKSGENTTIYGLILTTYKSGDIDMYIANKATGTINGSGSAASVGNLAKYIGGDTSGTAITGWTSASTEPVPEPTSAMLLMLGLCGLALKRKNA